MIVYDTSFLAGLYNARDPHNAAARAAHSQFAAGVWERGLLLEYVFLETTSVLLKRIGLKAAQIAGRTLLESADTIFVPCSPRWLRAAADFLAQSTTSLSLADIAVVQYALEHAGGQVLGFDQEFRKVPGIRLLPATR